MTKIKKDNDKENDNNGFFGWTLTLPVTGIGFYLIINGLKKNKSVNEKSP